MRTFQYPLEVGASETGPFVSLTAVVDTGASYTLIPRRVLRDLGVTPRGRQQFLVADGRMIEREIGFVYIRLDGEVRPSVWVSGDDDGTALLGAITLEAFGLTVDPVNRRLVPLPYLYLLRTG